MRRFVRSKRKRSAFWPPLLVFAQLSWAASAPAESAPAESAPAGGADSAERLFQDGLSAMLARQYAVACPRLAESYRSDPLPGVLFTLAECEANWKKLASALAHYQAFANSLTSMTAERRETFEERRRIAAGQIEVLSVSAPELTVNAPAAAPPTLLVTADGVTVPQGSYGVGRRVDPGSHLVSAEIDGKRVWERTVTLEPGDHARLDVELAPPPLDASQRLDAQPSLGKAEHAADERRTWLYVAGGVGIAGLTTGLVSGVLAYSRTGTVDSNCPESSCNAKGRAALDTARGEARVSTVAFSLGVVGTAAAVLLLLLDPTTARSSKNPATRSSRLSWSIASDGSSLSLGSRF
jgi:hypothetical protein